MIPAGKVVSVPCCRLAAWVILGAVLGLAAACSSTPGEHVDLPRLAGAQDLLAVRVPELPGFVANRYRLQPDRRLLIAVEAIEELVRGPAASPATATYEEGRWRIAVGGQRVGELSEFPGFGESTALLMEWAEQGGLSATGPADDTGLRAMREAVARAEIANILGELATAEAAGDALPVRMAASGYAWLAWLAVDAGERTDPLRGRAWAWAAVEKLLSGEEVTENEVLMARALGYEAEAATLASALAEGEPVRLYVQGEEERLAATCPVSADRACHLLRLALLAEREQGERFRAALRESPFALEMTLPVAGLALRVAEFGEQQAIALQVAELALAAVISPRDARKPGAPGDGLWAVPAARTRDFEAALDRFASVGTGGLVPPEVVDALFGSAFYAGLFGEARFLLDRLASEPAAKGLAAELSVRPSPAAEELARWITVRADVLAGSEDLSAVVELLARSDSLGSVALCELTAITARRTVSTDPRRRHGIAELFARLDTRPAHRQLASRVARSSLTSAQLHERLIRAAVAAAPYSSGELAAVVSKMDGDRERLRQIADDPAMPSYAQIVAVDALWRTEPADDVFVRSHYEAMAADPDGGLPPLLDFLEERGELADALDAVEGALERDGGTDGLSYAYLMTQKARLLARMDRIEEAFEAIRPVLSAFREETLLVGADIQLARGRGEEALRLARAALDRYPQSGEGHAFAARALWLEGDPGAAAREAARSPNFLRPWTRYLPEAFAAAFAEAPAAEAEAALEALQAAGMPAHKLADIAVAWGGTGALEPALRLLDGLHDPAPEWDLQIRIETYQLLQDARGAETARSWLRSALPQPSHEFALSLYQEREYELLLDLFPSGEEASKHQVVRLLKIASLLHLDEVESERGRSLVEEIGREKAEGGFFIAAARVLAGLDDDAVLLQPLAGLDDAADLGWAMGIRAASERRFEDAESWFQVALESGQSQQPPHAWSLIIERAWLQSSLSLASLEAAGTF